LLSFFDPVTGTGHPCQHELDCCRCHLEVQDLVPPVCVCRSVPTPVLLEVFLPVPVQPYTVVNSNTLYPSFTASLSAAALSTLVCWTLLPRRLRWRQLLTLLTPTQHAYDPHHEAPNWFSVLRVLFAQRHHPQTRHRGTPIGYQGVFLAAGRLNLCLHTPPPLCRNFQNPGMRL
jgi:hypothetical protein